MGRCRQVWAVLAAVLASFGAEAAIDLPPEEVLLGLRQARAHELAGRVVEQRAVLEALVKNHPEDTKALFELFDFYSRNHDAENIARLRALLITQLQTPQRVPSSLLSDAIVDRRMGPAEIELMLAEVERRSALNSPDVALLRTLAAGYRRLDNPVKQRETLVRLIAVEPVLHWKYELIEIDQRLERWEDVLTELRALASETRRSTWLALRELDALVALGRIDEASSVIDHLVITPEIARGLSEMAFARSIELLDRGSAPLAEKLLRRFSTANPSDRNLARAVAYLFGSVEDQAKLEASFVAGTLKSGDLETLVNDAAARVRAGDPASAIPLLEKATQVAPVNEVPRFNLAVAATKLEQWAVVERAATRTIEINNGQARARMLRAQARVKTGRIVEGMADAKAALAIDPALKQAWFVLYLGAKLQHDEAAAAEYLKKSK